MVFLVALVNLGSTLSIIALALVLVTVKESTPVSSFRRLLALLVARIIVFGITLLSLSLKHLSRRLLSTASSPLKHLSRRLLSTSTRITYAVSPC